MAHMPALYLLPLPQDPPESGRVILRDGTPAIIRLAQPSDVGLLREFIAGLSPESRLRRFFSAGVRGDDTMARLADSSDPRRQVTLIVTRGEGSAVRVIATGSYVALDEESAEVAMVVADVFQRR